MSGPQRRVRAYKAVAGVTPCPAGWLVLPGNVAGVTVVAEQAVVLKHLRDVLDFRPAFDAVAVNIQIGYPDEPGDRFRQCDVLAREMLGWPRRIAVRPTPCRAALFAPNRDAACAIDPWLTPGDFSWFGKMREAASEYEPFHSRSVFGANADVSFMHMNGDVGLTSSPWHESGRVERLALVRAKMPGVDEVVGRQPPSGAHQKHMYDAAAMLWTARRASGRAIARLPVDPEWNAEGIRLEIAR